MNGVAGQGAYLVLLRVFFSYTRRITVEGEPDTTAELAKNGKFLRKQQGSGLRLPYITKV
jgi:hypothetical protein